MNRFTEYSRRERESLLKLFKNNPNYKLEFTPEDGFDPYDAILTNLKTGKKFLIEVKHKTVSLEHIILRYRGLIIEKNKFDKLMELSKQYDMPVYYINFCSCGAVLTNLISPETITEWAYNFSSKTTAGDNTEIVKYQGFIDIKKEKTYLQVLEDYDRNLYPRGIESVKNIYFKYKK